MSDPHFGHKNIHKFRNIYGFTCPEDNEDRIISDWNSCVTKRDIVYVLGDSAFTQEGLDKIGQLKGRKILLRGNHCDLHIHKYLEVFEEVYGIHRYKNFWLSHAPIHPDELRGKYNLHGHVHYKTIRLPKTLMGSVMGQEPQEDPRYLNCCPENLWPKYGRCLISLAEVREEFKRREVILCD